MIPTPPPHEALEETLSLNCEAEIAKAHDVLGDVSRAILEARKAFSQGALPTLTHVEDMIRTACNVIRSVPRNNAISLRDRLEALFYDLDTLETDMRSRFGDLALRSEGLPCTGNTQAETVGSAYRRAQERQLHVDLEENAPASS